mmetsp:Transcript_56886/g.120762  ORF Transcript_56886/g.120762 Transcript_56886/m.120762 type:complete len:265 (-) Transcript_56886:397-1191(-)
MPFQRHHLWTGPGGRNFMRRGGGLSPERKVLQGVERDGILLRRRVEGLSGRPSREEKPRRVLQGEQEGQEEGGEAERRADDHHVVPDDREGAARAAGVRPARRGGRRDGMRRMLHQGRSGLLPARPRIVRTRGGARNPVRRTGGLSPRGEVLQGVQRHGILLRRREDHLSGVAAADAEGRRVFQGGEEGPEDDQEAERAAFRLRLAVRASFRGPVREEVGAPRSGCMRLGLAGLRRVLHQGRGTPLPILPRLVRTRSGGREALR